MTLTEIFTIIIFHWIGDFVLQTDKQAKGKSKNWIDLLGHTLTYSSVWVFTSCILFGINLTHVPYYVYVYLSFLFGGITFICHTITDYFTSRLNAKLWATGDVHNFFVSVGFDQVLHYIQLFTTYYLLTNGTN